jgi:anthranilate phosphoribosyltransferase
MADPFPQILSDWCDGHDLTAERMRGVMHDILAGNWTPAQIAAAIIALKIKGEKPVEIAAAASVMREMASKVPLSEEEKATAIDLAGTGGDGSGTFNISTAVCFVVAAAGVPVAKHGNRAISGTSGSSDVLEALGAKVAASPEQVATLIRQVGIGFMFAPNYHAAMKHAAPVRKELGVRTLFNLLGPLSNPAGVRRQVIGVFSPELLAPYAQTLANLSTTRAWVVHGDGLDEISISGETEVAELRQGTVFRHTLAPEDVGLKRAPLADIQVSSAAESKDRLLSVMNGEAGAARDIVLMNAAAALLVAERVDDFAQGVERAAAAIDDGGARRKLDEFIAATQSL